MTEFLGSVPLDKYGTLLCYKTETLWIISMQVGGSTVIEVHCFGEEMYERKLRMMQSSRGIKKAKEIAKMKKTYDEKVSKYYKWAEKA